MVRSALTSHPALDALMQRTQVDFAQIMADIAQPELQSLQDELTVTLKSYVPDAAVSLQWSQLPQLTMPDPQTDVRLEEDGYLSAVTHTGHGLQRAFIVTLLQQLSAARETNGEQDEALIRPQTPNKLRRERLPPPVSSWRSKSRSFTSTRVGSDISPQSCAA